MSYSIFIEVIFGVILLLPVLAFVLRFIFPITVDRILVGKCFSWCVLAYVAVSFFVIYLSSFCESPIFGTPGHYQYFGDHAWNHLFSPGSSINGGDDIWYYRIIDVLGVFIFNVLLITTLVNSMARLREKWKAGRIYYNNALYGCLRQKKVTVVLGNHEAVFEIVRQCLARNGKRKPAYVLALIDGDVDEYRSRMISVIPRQDIKRVILCRGSLTSRLDLVNIHIEKASEVFIVGNKIDQSGGISMHDAECIKCIRLLRDDEEENKAIVTSDRLRRYDTLMCRVFFEYQTSYSVFQTADIGGEESCPIEGNSQKHRRAIAFKPVNFYEQSCEKVIACPNSVNADYIPIDGEDGINELSEQYVHLIVVGQTKMGTALAIETAHLAHFPNFHKEENGRRTGPRTRITFIDGNADIEKDYFMGRLPALFELSPWRYMDMSICDNASEWVVPMENKSSQFSDGHIGKDFIDVEWEFIKGNVASDPVKEFLKTSVCESNAKCTIAICFHNQNDSVAAAQYLPEEICLNAQEILVYQSREGSVIDEMIKFDKSGRFSNFRSFGTISKFYDDELSYRMESQFDENLVYFDSGQSKDKSQIARWWSNRYRELTKWIKLRSFGPDYENINREMFSKVEHSRWNMEQLLLGFRPLTKDEQKSYLDIPEYEKTMRRNAKNELKSKKAHLDICSCAKLEEIDPDVIEYDSPDAHLTLKPEYIGNYHPNPISTDAVHVSAEIVQLAELLAVKVHGKWMEKRISEGWTYGKRRNDSKKKHPCIVPYPDLPESEKEYDRNTSMETLKTMLSLGYSIMPSDGDKVSVLPYSGCDEIPEELAKNVHDVWALNRMNDGWSYGEERDDINKKHPCLVPYGLLPDSEKKYDRATAFETIKNICSLGYSVYKD